MTLSDLQPTFQGHGVIFRPIDALNVLCAQPKRDLFAIAKFLFVSCNTNTINQSITSEFTAKLRLKKF